MTSRTAKKPAPPKAKKNTARKRASKKRPGKGTGKPVGRRGLIHNVELVEAVIEAVEKGNVLKDAAEANGLGEDTFHEWRRRGSQALEVARGKVGDDASLSELLEAVEDRERPYAAFTRRIARAVSRAKTSYQDVLATLMAKAKSSDPREQRVALDAAKFALERRWPEDYGRADRLQLMGDDKQPVALKIFLPQLEKDPGR